MTCGRTGWVGFGSRGVPRMCVGVVESCEKCGNFREISGINCGSVKSE